MRFKFLFVSVFLIFSSFSDFISGIHVLNFKEFEPRLHINNDTTYVINFWATWCIPCRRELPDFEKIDSAYQSEKVKILLVNLDFPDAIRKSLVPFIKKNNIRSEVIVLDDPNSNYWINQVDSSWNGNIPATLIYNKKNNFREFYATMMNYEELNSILLQNTEKQ